MTLREYLKANMFDGDDAGQTTMLVTRLLDDVVENVALWMIDQSGAQEAVDTYYGVVRS